MTRVLSAIALLPVVLGVVWWLPPLGTLLLAEVVVLVAVLEYVRLVTPSAAAGPRALTAAGALVTCAAVATAPGMVPAVLMVVVVAVAGIQGLRGEPETRLRSVLASGFALLYLAVPLGALAGLRDDMGRGVVLLFLATIMVSDTSQYYGGRSIGRRPLAPTLSPGKTVEGAVCGVIGGAVVLLVGGAGWLGGLAPGWRAALGASVAGCGILGDLFESGLKRSAGVKDASSLIPGHGGVLDRIDGMLFAMPVYYAVLQFLR